MWRSLLGVAAAVALLAGCSLEVPGQASPVASGPPQAPQNAVLRPSFSTTTEGQIDGGTAFLARWSDGRILLLTAQHLFGEALGLSRDHTGAELPDLVTGMTATSVDDESVEVSSGTLITIPDAVPLTTDITRDVAGFVVDGTAAAAVLDLAPAPPAPGARVWLLAEVSGSADRLFPATVQDVAPEEYLQYVFDTPLDLTATSGAPVLDAAGQVVGINVGGDDGTGVANSIATVRPLLEDAL